MSLLNVEAPTSAMFSVGEPGALLRSTTPFVMLNVELVQKGAALRNHTW